MARFQELERAACDVIQNVKEIQDLRHARLSVIGGLALWHYLPEYRSTDNVNFITNISTSPSSLKKRLLERPDSPFFQRSQALFYKCPNGEEVRIDISPEWLSPYLPESAVKVQDISQDEIPYISLTDLIVFKLDSSGLRSNPAKKERDAYDAAALVDLACSRRGSIDLSKKQEQVVEEALCDVAECGAKEKDWWEKHMGLDTRESRALEVPGGRSQQRKGRPHSKSDPSPSRTLVTNDPNAAWHYEKLDRAHMRQFKSMHSSRTGGRPGMMRSASHRMIRDTGLILTQPKTTHASFQNEMKRSGLSNEVSSESPYSDNHDEQYYTLEPRGSPLGGSPIGRSARGGREYFDLPRTPSGSLGTVTEHSAIGVRRTSKAGYFDLSPADAPSTVVQPRRRPGMEKRSVTFLL
ncbi:hypothetical protein F4781DRAFT_427663 [Annulohypoxylon bovei var. microspora]|nr:hypothetical protein F4781DRAFT_427663 [Annulohypoxylon bovei var. microspora]